MDVMQAPGAADARRVNWVDGRHILKPDSALVRAALDLLAAHVADAAAGTSPRCGQCGRYFPCPTVENARQVVVAGGGLLTVAGQRDRKGSAAAVRTAVGDPVVSEAAVAPVRQKATGGTLPPESELAIESVAGGPRGPVPVAAAPVAAATEGSATEQPDTEAPVTEGSAAEGAAAAEAAAEGSAAERSAAAEAAAEGSVVADATPAGATATGPAGALATGMVVTVTQIPTPLVKGLPGPRVPETAAGPRKGSVTGAGDQAVAAGPVGAA